ncbi:hypothetical protein HHK36_030280 [Tetracentron sinense]|uniref:Uncharacterized protein n=1 Tax=Tetracentron sinense TaxID=13715 RepID=A0A834YAU7_TETSI|nr:hypothetical protein HHK36_030280 [Tetracentron sinense]
MERFIQPYCSVGLRISAELRPLSNWHVKSCVPFEELQIEELPTCKSLKTKSNLSGLNLDGEISPAIGDLKDLLSIDVSNNSPTGSIPQNIGNCTGFQGLVLQPAHRRDSFQYWLPASGNIISARKPAFWENTISYRSDAGTCCAHITPYCGVDMQWGLDPFIGNICSIFKLKNQPALKMFSLLRELNDNHFCGHIPPELGMLTDLFDLMVLMDISNNRITGSIPSSLGDLEHLLKLRESEKEPIVWIHSDRVWKFEECYGDVLSFLNDIFDTFLKALSDPFDEVITFPGSFLF